MNTKFNSAMNKILLLSMVILIMALIVPTALAQESIEEKSVRFATFNA